MNVLEFAFKGSKYARNIVFCWYSGRVFEILKKRSGCLYYTGGGRRFIEAATRRCSLTNSCY